MSMSSNTCFPDNYVYFLFPYPNFFLVRVITVLTFGFCEVTLSETYCTWGLWIDSQFVSYWRFVWIFLWGLLADSTLVTAPSVHAYSWWNLPSCPHDYSWLLDYQEWSWHLQLLYLFCLNPGREIVSPPLLIHGHFQQDCFVLLLRTVYWGINRVIRLLVCHEWILGPTSGNSVEFIHKYSLQLFVFISAQMSNSKFEQQMISCISIPCRS
jgi:hypothetical protein